MEENLGQVEILIASIDQKTPRGFFGSSWPLGQRPFPRGLEAPLCTVLVRGLRRQYHPDGPGPSNPPEYGPRALPRAGAQKELDPIEA